MSELVHQLFAGGATDERPDNVRVRDVEELGTQLGEMSDKVPKRLMRLLTAAPEVSGVPKVHICALEILDEDLD